MLRFPRAAGLTGLLYLLLHVLVPAANAQFKEIGPPPFSPAVARQQIRTLLDQVEPANRQQTLDKLNGLTPWFRNILDEELIACWERDGRERLTLVMEPLASPRVAAAVVEFSWSARRDALNLAYAPMLGNLMARYPESGKGFLSDLLGPAPPNLSPPEAETVCRILLDMPDIGTWRQSALRILPRYRATAERLLIEDRQGDDPEKSYRAQVWLAELRGESPGATNQPSIARRKVPISPAPDDNAGPSIYASPPAGTAERRPQATAGTPPPVQPPPAAPVPASSQPYNGPMSGTLECNGGLVPQNAEYVFGNLPPLKIQLDYNKKIWEGRLAPGENQTQRLILKNKSSGPQKRCVVHWSVVP